MSSVRLGWELPASNTITPIANNTLLARNTTTPITNNTIPASNTMPGFARWSILRPARHF